MIHELAHVAVGRTGVCVLDDGGELSRREHTDIEAFCSHVAGAALVPEAMLREDKDVPINRVSAMEDDAVKRIAGRFGVSREVVLRRLLEIGLIMPDFYKKKRAELLKQYASIDQQRQDGGRVPPGVLARSVVGDRFARLVIHAWEEERISSSELSDYLDVKFQHVAAIREALQKAESGGNDEEAA